MQSPLLIELLSSLLRVICRRTESQVRALASGIPIQRPDSGSVNECAQRAIRQRVANQAVKAIHQVWSLLILIIADPFVLARFRGNGLERLAQDLHSGRPDSIVRCLEPRQPGQGLGYVYIVVHQPTP